MNRRTIKIYKYRSAKTGEFVKEKYAKNHPSTTVREVAKTLHKNKSRRNG